MFTFYTIYSVQNHCYSDYNHNNKLIYYLIILKKKQYIVTPIYPFTEIPFTKVGILQAFVSRYNNKGFNLK